MLKGGVHVCASDNCLRRGPATWPFDSVSSGYGGALQPDITASVQRGKTIQLGFLVYKHVVVLQARICDIRDKVVHWSAASS